MFETILSGVLVFVTGQAILKLVVEPVQNLKSAFGEVAEALRIHGPFLYNLGALDDDQRRTLQQEILRVAGLIQSRSMIVPWYRFWSRIFCLPSFKQLERAHQNFTTIANYVGSTHELRETMVMKNVQELCDALGIYVPENSKVDPKLLEEMIKAYLESRRA